MAMTFPRVLGALEKARQTKGRPTMILAKTLKGKGISFMEGKGGWHGKAVKKGDGAGDGARRAQDAARAGERPGALDPRAERA